MSVNVLYEMNRMTSRAQINDMDKCTIFSVYPKDIEEKKITLMPFMYQIPAGTPEKPSRTVIGPASWWRDVDPEQPLIEIPVSSVVVAQSVVLDYTKSVYGYTAGKRCPGIFFLTGDISAEWGDCFIKTKHIAKIADSRCCEGLNRPGANGIDADVFGP